MYYFIKHDDTCIDPPLLNIVFEKAMIEETYCHTFLSGFVLPLMPDYLKKTLLVASQ